MAVQTSKPLLLPPFPLLRFFSSHQNPNFETAAATTVVEGEEEELISNVVSILREQKSKSRWGFLRSIYHRHSFTPSQVSQITLRLRSNPRLALRFFHWADDNNNTALSRHDLSSYATIIHVLARSRLRSAALSMIQSAILSHERGKEGGVDDGTPLEMFQTLVRTYRECDSAPFVFDLLIRARLLAKRIDQALEIVRMLRSKGISPEARTSNELIRVVSRARGADAGFDIYREIYGSNESRSRGFPNVQTFNSLLLSFYREGRMVEKGAEVRAEMEKFGIDPNCFTFCILMAGFCDEEMVEDTMRIWEEMRRKQIEPDAMAYNTVIGGFSKVGDVGRAEELFREMVLGGIKPTSATYEHLLRGHCNNGDANAAVLVYNDMQRKNFRPEVSVVEEMISELCERGRVAEGLRVLRNEMRRGGFHPSRGCYKSLVKGLCADGEMAEALKLQAEMVGKGFEPDSEVYSAFIDGYMNQGEVEKTGKLKEEMFKLGV